MNKKEILTKLEFLLENESNKYYPDGYFEKSLCLLFFYSYHCGLVNTLELSGNVIFEWLEKSSTLDFRVHSDDRKLVDNTITKWENWKEVMLYGLSENFIEWADDRDTKLDNRIKDWLEQEIK